MILFPQILFPILTRLSSMRKQELSSQIILWNLFHGMIMKVVTPTDFYTSLNIWNSPNRSNKVFEYVYFCKL